MRNREKPGGADLLAAAQTLAEGPIADAAQGIIDVVNQPAGLRGQQERFFALHRIGPLIGHMERMARMIPGGFFGGRIKIHIFEQPHIAHQLFATGEQDLFESL